MLVDYDIGFIRGFVEQLGTRFGAMERQLAVMDSRLNELVDRIDMIGHSLPPLDLRLDSEIETRPASRTHDGRIVVDVDAWQRLERIEQAASVVAHQSAGESYLVELREALRR